MAKLTSEEMELKVVKKLLTLLLRAGFNISVDDGGDDFSLKNSTDKKAILDAIFSFDADGKVKYMCTDLIKLRAAFHHDKLGYDVRGTVMLVGGNSGYDVVCDYSTSLDEWMDQVNTYSDNLEAKYA